jgi:hypothetical protein
MTGPLAMKPPGKRTSRRAGGQLRRSSGRSCLMTEKGVFSDLQIEGEPLLYWLASRESKLRGQIKTNQASQQKVD